MVGLGVTLLGGVGLARQQDQSLFVDLETGHVDGQALLGEILATVVDGDTDGAGQRSGDASLLELSQGETSASSDLAVVLNSRASDNGTQLLDGARSQSSSLGLTSDTARGLLSGLVKVG